MPVVNEFATPAVSDVRVAALESSTVRETAVSSLDLDALARVIIEPLGTGHSIRGLILLNPVDNVPDDIVGCILCIAVLTESPGTDTASAVVHTTDAEEAQKFIEAGVVKTHIAGNIEIVTLTGFGADGGVHQTVIHDELLAGSLEGAEVALEGRDITMKNVGVIGLGVVSLRER